MPGGLGNGCDAAHERSADTEDVKMHGDSTSGDG